MLWLTRFFRAASPQERADRLMKRGLSLVKKGKTAEALRVARELHAIRYSGCFEIEAQALAREGSKEEAVKVLRKGLEVAPASWLNGNLLGNYLSDEGRYDEAFAAYEEALRTPTADRILIECQLRHGAPASGARRRGASKDHQGCGARPFKGRTRSAKVRRFGR